MSVPLLEKRIGVQEPRIFCEPEGIVGSYGQSAIDMAENVGLYLDPWQKMSMHNILAIKDDMYYNKYTKQDEFKWAARTCGLVVSRQNGKGSILEARALAGLFIVGDRLIIHSAHEHDTAQEAHVRLMALIDEDPELRKQVLRAPTGHGEQGIELRNGQRMRFRTRTSGGGRGFTADCVILDEAMILENSFVGALMPTLSARPNPQLIYTGSAGNRKSVAFGKIRRNAIAKSPTTFFAEWSIDACNAFCGPNCQEHDQPDDIESWLKANPSYGIRDLGYDDIVSEMENMDPEEFARERLGVGTWPVDANGWLIIPKPNWQMRQDLNSELIGEFAISVDVASDQSISTITAAGVNQLGDVHIEVTANEIAYDHRPGVQWVVPRIKEIWRNVHPRPAFVVIDKQSNAGQFIEDLEADRELNIKIVSPNTREHAQACATFHNGVVPRTGEVAYITHTEDADEKGHNILSNGVAGLDTRTLTDGYAWNKKDAGAIITPVVSATNAVWGYKKFCNKPTFKPWVMRD